MRRPLFPPLLAAAFMMALASPALAEKILTITSEPSDARVVIGGNFVGNTPVQMKLKEFLFNGPKYFWSEFLTGPLQMTVSKEDYLPQTITITSGPYQWVDVNLKIFKTYYVITQTSFHVQLQRSGPAVEAGPFAADGRAEVTVNSEPTGAEVYVDGRFDSSTPARLRLTPGAHVIGVTRPGFKLWVRQITVEPGAEKTLNALLESGTDAASAAAAPLATAQPPPAAPRSAAADQGPELVVVTGHARRSPRSPSAPMAACWRAAAAARVRAASSCGT